MVTATLMLMVINHDGDDDDEDDADEDSDDDNEQEVGSKKVKPLSFANLWSKSADRSHDIDPPPPSSLLDSALVVLLSVTSFCIFLFEILLCHFCVRYGFVWVCFSVLPPPPSPSPPPSPRPCPRSHVPSCLFPSLGKAKESAPRQSNSKAHANL